MLAMEPPTLASLRRWIGTIPLGYADGWTRDMQGFDVLIDVSAALLLAAFPWTKLQCACLRLIPLARRLR